MRKRSLILKVVFFLLGGILLLSQSFDFRSSSITTLRRVKIYSLLWKHTPRNFEPEAKFKVALIALDKDETLTKARRPLDDFTAEKLCGILKQGIKVVVITGSDAVNTFKCIYLPLKEKLEEMGEDMSILDNLILYCSAGSVAYTFENGERRRLEISQQLLSEEERFQVWYGMIKGVVDALKEFINDNKIQMDQNSLNNFENQIDKINQQDGSASHKIQALNNAFKEFVGKFPNIFGEGENAMHIRDENELPISEEDMKMLGITENEKEDFYAPKITLELSHLPENSPLRSADFTKIVKEQAKEICGGIANLNFKYGSTYVDIARSKGKIEVVKEVQNNFDIGEGSIILGGDSSNDVDMLTMDFGDRVVFRFYVGKKAKFKEYFTEDHGANVNNVNEVIKSFSEEGPKEIGLLFQHVLDAFGKPMREFKFIQNRYSWADISRATPVDIIQAREKLIPEAQKLLNFLASNKIGSQYIGASNFTNEDFEMYNPVMLILGSPSPQTFVEAAIRWHQYQKWWEEAGNKGYVPVIASTGRGRGYKELVLNTLEYLKRNYPTLAQDFQKLYQNDIQEAKKGSPEKLMQEYENADQGKKKVMLTEAKVIKFLLTAFGVPEGAIFLEENSNNTFSNMEWSYYLITGKAHPNLQAQELQPIEKPLIKMFNDQNRPLKIHVITDGFHQLRALLTAIAKFNEEAGENWEINGEALYVPNLGSMDNPELLQYLEHMIGDPYGMAIFDEEGKLIKYGEIERLIKYGLTDKYNLLKSKIYNEWQLGQYQGRIYKLRTQFLREFKDAIEKLEIKHGG